MQASVGDRIVVYGGTADETVRAGEILEVHGMEGAPPYLVQWDDGRKGLYLPEARARVQHFTPASRRSK